MSDDLYDTIQAQYKRLGDEISSRIADGKLSLRDVRLIVAEFIVSATVIARKLSVPVEERERLVIQATLRLWDERLEPLDLPGPDALLDPWIRQSLPVIAAWLFDQAAWLDEKLLIPI